MKCPTPSKRKYKNRHKAVRGAIMALTVFGHKKVVPYECKCGWWHFSTQQHKLTERENRRLTNARNIRKYFGTNRQKLK